MEISGLNAEQFMLMTPSQIIHITTFVKFASVWNLLVPAFRFVFVLFHATIK